MGLCAHFPFLSHRPPELVAFYVCLGNCSCFLPTLGFFIFGWFFLFYFRSLFFFQLVKSMGPIRTKGPTNWRHSYWRDPQCLCKGKIKSKSPESFKSKFYRPHFPSSTDPIFQAPPIPFSKLHRSHFPGSTVSIFQAPPSPFSKLHRPHFQAPPSPFSKLRRLYFHSISRHSINLDSKSKQLKSFLLKTFMPTHRQTRHPLWIPLHSQLQPFSPSTMDSSVSLGLDHMVMGHNLSKFLKSFLLKKLLRPLRRLEQPMMSIETFKIAQDKHQLITNGTHAPVISQLLNIFKYNNSLLLPFSAISNQWIEFTKGLLALLMAQDHQTACLQVIHDWLSTGQCIIHCLHYETPFSLPNHHLSWNLRVTTTVHSPNHLYLCHTRPHSLSNRTPKTFPLHPLSSTHCSPLVPPPFSTLHQNPITIFPFPKDCSTPSETRLHIFRSQAQIQHIYLDRLRNPHTSEQSVTPFPYIYRRLLPRSIPCFTAKPCRLGRFLWKQISFLTSMAQAALSLSKSMDLTTLQSFKHH